MLAVRGHCGETVWGGMEASRDPSVFNTVAFVLSRELSRITELWPIFVDLLCYEPHVITLYCVMSLPREAVPPEEWRPTLSKVGSMRSDCNCVKGGCSILEVAT